MSHARVRFLDANLGSGRCAAIRPQFPGRWPSIGIRSQRLQHYRFVLSITSQANNRKHWCTGCTSPSRRHSTRGDNRNPDTSFATTSKAAIKGVRSIFAGVCS